MIISVADEFCEEFPHNLIPTPGYWIECSRQKIASDTIWDESESEHEIHEEEEEEEEESGGIRNRDREDDGVGADEGTGEGTSGSGRGDVDQCLLEDDEEDEDLPKKKTVIEEMWEKNQGFELTSVEQETYEKYLYGTEHWNYFTNDEDLGPVILSIKQETLNGRDQFSYTVHGLIPASCVFADRYNREEVVRSLGKEVNINPPLTLGQLPDTPEELLKLDQVFIKSELKVGVIYVKEGQYTEEEILDNNDNSFDKYKGGLDTVHDLTVTTEASHRKRYSLCSVPGGRQHFFFSSVHQVSVVTRDEVGAYKPYLWEQSVFDKGPMFREWLLTKIVNGERASYSAPKFARMQERTRSQMLEDIVANLANHAETGQIPKPYRRGSWRPIGHMRPSSPLLDSVRDQFEDYDQLAKDFTRMFLNNDENTTINANLFDVVFLVGQSKQKTKFIGVRAILGVRSRVFQEMLYGISTGFGSPQVPVAELLARAVPTLHSPQKPKSSNFLQVPDIETPRRRGIPPDKDGKDKEKEGKSQIPQLAVPRLSFPIIEFDPETFRILLDYLHTGSCPLTCSNIPDFLTLSESMVQMIMCRNLEVPEVRKFEAMLGWARHKIRSKTSSKLDAKLEFKCIMERLARDLKLYRISPQELIKIVLPSKAIKNERILETLMFQANSGMYRIQDSYLEACQQRLQKQDSRFSEWESFDYGL
ncbi:hypothetical protein C0J52_22680 [Blattella germanica]|nr:hypothetical protein C0J52_22680 [Blattella germanica]